MSEIRRVYAREILDARGFPTVEAAVETVSGIRCAASVPSLLPSDIRAKYESRDGDPGRYEGQGVFKACRSVEDLISPALKGVDVSDQRTVDNIMLALDGTPQKEILGTNAVLAVSYAAARTAAKAAGLPLFRYLGGVRADKLPVPVFFVIDGGVLADAPLAFRGIGIHSAGFDTFSESLAAGAAVWRALSALVRERSIVCTAGITGGLAPHLDSVEKYFELLAAAVERAGFTAGDEILFSLDCAAGDFLRDSVYDYGVYRPGGLRLSRAEQMDYIVSLAGRFPIDQVTDPLGEDDFDDFAVLRTRLCGRCRIAAGNLFAGERGRICRGISAGAVDSVILNPAECGTVSEFLEAAETAQDAGLAVTVACREAECCDDFPADLAVAVNAAEIKCGPVGRGEHNAKYNRLLELENPHW